MMRQYYILHLGAGNVGKTLIRQLFENKKLLLDKYKTQFVYYGIYNSKTAIISKKGLSYKQIHHIPPSHITPQDALASAPFPLIVIDTTASDQTAPFLLSALRRNAYVVMSNKKPLTGSQKQYNQLHKFGKNRLFYETTVGAGLPIIRTIKSLVATGDSIEEIQGVFSGTLGYICSNLETGKSFSSTVMEANNKGFTEPDPRDDLSGTDVRRKALILSRLIGNTLALEDIPLKKLYPKRMDTFSVDMFLQNISQLDKIYNRMFTHALKKNQTIRYIARITKTSTHVGLQSVGQNTLFGRLEGPENLISIKSKRYHTSPLVINGPGAGLEVTAAGVFADLLTIAQIL